LPATISIVRAGTQVPQESLVEITSRSAYFVDQLDWNELYPQLVLSQTPNLRLGVHERGTFTEIREWQVPGTGTGAGVSANINFNADSNAASPGADTGALPALTTPRREMAAQLVRLARVLEDIQELAISRGPGPEGSFSLVYEYGELRAYGRVGAKSCLPLDVKARFSSAGERATGVDA
jgi:hypothetical protein